MELLILPDELLHHISSFLTLAELLVLQQTSSRLLQSSRNFGAVVATHCMSVHACDTMTNRNQYLSLNRLLSQEHGKSILDASIRAQIESSR